MIEPIKWDDPPLLAVIDRAIELIRSGAARYTCVALSVAFGRVEPFTKWYWERQRLYTTQYRKCVWGPKGQHPVWWGEADHPYKRERIAALKKFRQACIDAAKKE